MELLETYPIAFKPTPGESSKHDKMGQIGKKDI